MINHKTERNLQDIQDLARLWQTIQRRAIRTGNRSFACYADQAIIVRQQRDRRRMTMRTCAQKQKQPQRRASFNLTRSKTAASAASHHVPPILHLQRTIGNHAVQRLLQSNTEEFEAGSATTASTRVAHDLSRIPAYPKVPMKAQTKLKVSTPGDVYEQAADRVADQVMRMPKPQLQRACPCGGGCPRCQMQQLGQKKEALSLLDKAQEIDPMNRQVRELLKAAVGN